MRILDRDENKALNRGTLYLTLPEAKQLHDCLHDLIDRASDKPGSQLHDHLYDDDYTRELVVAIYTEENISQFDEMSIKIIKGNNGK